MFVKDLYKMILYDIIITNKEYAKNIATLAALGWLPENVPDVICDLDVDDYFCGPSDDRDSDDRNCIWEFCKELPDEQQAIYIKLKITKDILAISFHFPEKPIIYPFK